MAQKPTKKPLLDCDGRPFPTSQLISIEILKPRTGQILRVDDPRYIDPDVRVVLRNTHHTCTR